MVINFMNTNKELWSDDYLKEFAHKVILSQTSNYEKEKVFNFGMKTTRRVFVLTLPNSLIVFAPNWE